MSNSTWHLPKNLLSQSITIMRPQGRMGNEGLAFWFGIENQNHLIVTHIVEVFGSGFISTPLHMSLSLKAMTRLTQLTEELDIYLIGQIHSHPGNFVDLSELDKRHGIRIPDYLSVVCPYYAQKDLIGFEECGLHVFENNKFRRMLNKEVSTRLFIQDLPLEKISIEVKA